MGSVKSLITVRKLEVEVEEKVGKPCEVEEWRGRVHGEDERLRKASEDCSLIKLTDL